MNDYLSPFFEIRFVQDNPESLSSEFRRCSVFLDASMKVNITSDFIRKAKHLELVVTATTGASHIDGEALQKRNIPLLTLKGQYDFLNQLTPAAEHSWLLLMACARRLRGAINHTMQGHWNRQEFPGVMLRNKSLGIIGMGRIGTWMAQYAQAFEMKVSGYDPYVNNNFPQHVQSADMDELLSTSDFVSVHVNLTKENKGMINAEKIKKMKKGAVFINTSRGDLVDERALLQAIKEGTIAAAGLDVLADEPNIENSELWKYAKQSDNVILTPHIGGYCMEAVDKAVEFSCQRIISFYKGEAR
ncbi:hypothetical protein KZ483_18430 [Paenibacillus sp. sptzw28]|nr:hypothetical protein KZ483_18430 [Paenibacillus sp. sptzw28]